MPESGSHRVMRRVLTPSRVSRLAQTVSASIHGFLTANRADATMQDHASISDVGNSTILLSPRSPLGSLLA
jgi:hypothetical protein